MIPLLRMAALIVGGCVLAALAWGVRVAEPQGWGSVAALGLITAGAAGGVALATAVAFLGGRVARSDGAPHPALPALVALPLGVAAFIAATLQIDPTMEAGDGGPFIERIVLAAAGIATVVVGAAICRLSVTFPRAVSAEELEHGRRRWNDQPAERRTERDTPALIRRLQKADAATNRAIAAWVERVLRPGPFRDDLVRILTWNPADPKIQPLTSWLGLPWSAWRWAGVLTVAVIVSTVPLLVPLTLLLAALAFTIMIVHGILYFNAVYIMLEPDEKRKVRWVAVALFLPCALPALSQGAYLLLTGLGMGLGALGLPDATAAMLATGAGSVAAILAAAIPVVLVAGLAIAIFWDGALDPGLVIRETAVYGLLSGILLVLFTGLESVLSDLLALRLDFPERSGGWVAGIVTALVFAPARSRLERRFTRNTPSPVASGREPPPASPPPGSVS